PPAPNVGYDKPWMAVDSTSGNVYLTWTAFPPDGSSLIRLQRLDPDLNPLGPPQDLRSTPPNVIYACQLSFPTVGPDGVLYVAWDIYYIDRIFAPLSHYEIVRSDDLGQTFGPITTFAEHQWDITALSPGNQRGIYPAVVALAVDMSQGPH